MVPDGVDNEPYPAVPDLDKAKALITESGVKTPLDAGTIYYPEASVNPDVAQQVQSDLKKIGLNMKVKGVNGDNYYQFIQDPANKDQIAIAGWEADFPDAITYFDPLLERRGRRWRLELRRLQGRGARRGSRHDQRDAPDARAARRRTASCRTSSSAEQAPWLTFVTRNNTNLVSTKYGGYHYGAVKTINLGLAYVNEG